MSVGKRLEIDNEFFRPVSLFKIFHALSTLLADRLQAAGGSGTERTVVAIGATVHPCSAIPIRAAEASVHADFVNPASEFFLQETAIGVVAVSGKWRLIVNY